MIGAREMEQEIAGGQRLTNDEFLALVERATRPVQPDGQPARPAPSGQAESAQSGLTPRELEVLRLVARGLTNAQVAQELVVTPRTVNAHLTAIYAKLGVTSRGGAIRYAVERRLA